MEIEDAQVMDMEVKMETLFKNETASSSMFFGSEELVERTTIIRTKVGGKSSAHGVGVRSKISQSNPASLESAGLPLVNTQSSNQPPK
jgi:hypothetical protein